MKALRWSRCAGILLLTVTLMTACGKGTGNTSSSSSTTSASGPATSAATAATQAPGITAKQVTVANVSTLSGPVPGLFQGAAFGTDAYFAYINSKGGVNGRKLAMKSEDDAFSCTNNETLTQADLSRVFAFVGSFSLFDQCGATVLRANPDVPDVHEALNPEAQAISNNFSVQPVGTGWRTGALVYYKAHYPNAVKHVGALVANVSSAESAWAGYEAAAKSLGYVVSYQRAVSPLETDFTADVARMRTDGVQYLVLFGAIQNIAQVLNDAEQQAWHPQVITSAGQLYDNRLFTLSSSAATQGAFNDQGFALFQGEDRSNVPEVDLFLT